MKAGKRTGSCSWMLFLWGVWVCASCTGGTNSFLMPSSSGNPYEVLVVADPQVWKRPAGRTLWDLLDTDMPGLPQSERAFRIMHADPWDFDATLRLAKNILVLDVDSTKYRRVSFACATDVYAKPQLVVTMQVPDEDSLAAAVAQYGASLLRLFTQAERKRRVEWLADHHGVYVAEQVKDMVSSFPVPVGGFNPARIYDGLARCLTREWPCAPLLSQVLEDALRGPYLSGSKEGVNE